MQIPISVLKKALDNSLGEGSWKDYETETLILDLDLPFSEVLFDKISVLKVLEHIPDIFFNDVTFMLYSTEVINNTSADFDFMPHITSLEMAFAIIEIASVLNVDMHKLPPFGVGPKTIIRDILINDGFSVPVAPFDIVGTGKLTEGQTAEDTQDKMKAIEDYIHSMYKIQQ